LALGVCDCLLHKRDLGSLSVHVEWAVSVSDLPLAAVSVISEKTRKRLFNIN